MPQGLIENGVAALWGQLAGGRSTRVQGREAFSGPEEFGPACSGVLAGVLFLLVLLVFGKYLWNSFVVDMFTCVQPIDSVWPLIALSIVVRLVVFL